MRFLGSGPALGLFESPLEVREPGFQIFMAHNLRLSLSSYAGRDQFSSRNTCAIASTRSLDIKR